MPTLFLGQPLALHTNENTKDHRTKEGREGVATANIGSAVDLDLHEKLLHRIGSIWCQNHVELNLYMFFSVQFFFVFHSESIFCPFKNTAANITWRYCHLLLNLYGKCRVGITCLDPILHM
jgi:hypothetical protein